MTVYLVGHMKDDTFVPCDVSIDMSEPQMRGVYVGHGKAQEVVGIMDDGVLMGELDNDIFLEALEHLWEFDPHPFARKRNDTEEK